MIERGRVGISGGNELGKKGTMGANLGLFYIILKRLTGFGCFDLRVIIVNGYQAKGGLDQV